MSEMADWSVAGSYFEACSCLPICPCRQVGGRDGGRSTFGVCDFALSWHVDVGHFGDIDLVDRQVVMVGSYDDDEAGSPWTVALFVDDGADSDQAEALTRIFLGHAGGTPSRNYAPAIKTVAHTGRAQIRLDHTRRHWRIQVAGAVSVTATALVDSPETVACGIPGLDHPGQEVRADELRVSVEGLSCEWSDRCGFATDYAYTSGS